MSEATEAIRRAVDGAENPTAAARALGHVAARHVPEYGGARDAFRWEAEQALTPLFPDAKSAKAVAWAVADAVWSAASSSRKSSVPPAQPLFKARSLREILADPSATAAPVAVADRLAYRGRTTLLAAREKLGKSTLARAVASAVSRNRSFLGAETSGETVLYVGLEEHLSDAARGLTDFHADPARVFLLDRVGDPFADLEAQVEALDPDLIVIDTLAAFVETLGVEPGSSAAWTPIMARLARVARDTDAAMLILHHGNKRDGSYRDSTAIGAGVDVVLEMSEDSGDATVRRIRARARFHLGDFAVRLIGEPGGSERPRYELSAGELSLDARVYLDIEGHHGTSTRELRDRVTGRTADIKAALVRHESRGAIENRGSPTAHRWFPLQTAGTDSGTGPGSREESPGTRAEPLSGTADGSGSAPYGSQSGNRPGEPDFTGDLDRALGGAA